MTFSQEDIDNAIKSAAMSDKRVSDAIAKIYFFRGVVNREKQSKYLDSATVDAANKIIEANYLIVKSAEIAAKNAISKTVPGLSGLGTPSGAVTKELISTAALALVGLFGLGAIIDALKKSAEAEDDYVIATKASIEKFKNDTSILDVDRAKAIADKTSELEAYQKTKKSTFGNVASVLLLGGVVFIGYKVFSLVYGWTHKRRARKKS